MVIATGRSRAAGRRAGRSPARELLERGIRRLSIEGLQQGDWVLIDAGDVIVHLFRPEVRTFYNLEKMWGRRVRRSNGGTAASSKADPRRRRRRSEAAGLRFMLAAVGRLKPGPRQEL